MTCSKTAAESSVESVTADVADMKVSEPAEAAAPPSKPEPDASTSMAAKHEEDYPHEEETAEERAKREAELQKIYADLAKEDDRCGACQLALHCGCMCRWSCCKLNWQMRFTSGTF